MWSSSNRRTRSRCGRPPSLHTLKRAETVLKSFLLLSATVPPTPCPPEVLSSSPSRFHHFHLFPTLPPPSGLDKVRRGSSGVLSPFRSINDRSRSSQTRLSPSSAPGLPPYPCLLPFLPPCPPRKSHSSAYKRNTRRTRPILLRSSGLSRMKPSAFRFVSLAVLIPAG